MIWGSVVNIECYGAKIGGYWTKIGGSGEKVWGTLTEIEASGFKIGASWAKIGDLGTR